MADDNPEMLPFTMKQLDFEVGIRLYDPDLEGVRAVSPDWLCVLQLPTPMHAWQVPYLEDSRAVFTVRLEELAQVDPCWMAATIHLETLGGRRVAAARRVRMFIGDDPWGVDTYFRDYDGSSVWAVNIRRVPSPLDAGQADPEQAAISPAPEGTDAA